MKIKRRMTWSAALLTAVLGLGGQSVSLAAPTSESAIGSHVATSAVGIQSTLNGVRFHASHMGTDPEYIIPGQSYVQQIRLANTLPIPQPITLKQTLTCTVPNPGGIIPTKSIDIPGQSSTVTVPGDPTMPAQYKGQKVMTTVKLTVKVPSNCKVEEPPYVGIRQDAQSKVSMAVPGFDSWGLNARVLLIGKAHTRENARYNLVIKSGQDSSDYQAHHTMPYKFEPTFLRYGINIHDPGYLIWWCSRTGVSTNHPTNSAAYNKKWETFLDTPGVTKSSILKYRTKIMSEYVYRCP